MRRTEAPLKAGVGLPKMNGKELAKQALFCGRMKTVLHKRLRASGTLCVMAAAS
jgi:hypothetical protein